MAPSGEKIQANSDLWTGGNSGESLPLISRREEEEEEEMLGER
jgi:hypothetical protein